MGFVDESLLPGETIIYRAHVHWKVFVLPAFFAIAAAVIAGSALVFPANAWLLIPGGIFAVPAVIIGIERWIRYSASEFAVTERRVLIKIGVIRRHVVELMLTKVEGIGVTQTVPGRLLNFGSISVTGTGGTRETFHEISSPLEFRRQVQARIVQSDESAQPSDPAPPAKA